MFLRLANPTLLSKTVSKQLFYVKWQPKCIQFSGKNLSSNLHRDISSKLYTHKIHVSKTVLAKFQVDFDNDLEIVDILNLKP